MKEYWIYQVDVATLEEYDLEMALTEDDALKMVDEYKAEDEADGDAGKYEYRIEVREDEELDNGYNDEETAAPGSCTYQNNAWRLKCKFSWMN